MSESSAKDSQASDCVRVDKWLWAVRLYKTRSLATQACKAGHVKVDGHPVKPSRNLHVGETLQARCGHVVRRMRVAELLERRVSAKDVPRFAEELAPPEDLRPPRQLPADSLSQPLILRPKGAGRPTKRDRRRLDALDWDG